MVLVLLLACIAIVGMFICILKFPSLRIGKLHIDTFYLPIFFVALILLLFPTFDKSELFAILFSDSTLNPLKILVLFISVSFLSIALDETGFLSYIATKFINKYNHSQKKLFFVLYALISFLTVFTSNDIVILTFTPFILYFAKRGNINPIPYLVMEFVAANTYSMMLSIGNPTNIYLASAFDLSFLDYFLKMIIPTLVCGISSLLILYLLFKKQLKKTIDVFQMDSPKIKNKPLCILALSHLILTTILLAISNYINLPMWIICLCFASSMCIILILFSIVKKNSAYLTSTIRRIPYSLIPFILSMFTIIMAVDSYQVFDKIASVLHMVNNDKVETILYLITSTLSCNILNNIPMTLSYSSILSSTTNLNFVYATIIGSNIGALLTPIGALAGIMWLRILKENHVSYSFLAFIKNGVILVFGLLLVGSITLCFF